MAIHAGEAERRGGNWFGPALNRCARLLAIGHGGQVLLSGSVRALLIDHPGARLSLESLGRHRLRDLAAPEDVFQLIASGMRREFPALRSLDAFRGNLPAQLTSFHGREAELKHLLGELEQSRLLTLTGPGGMGKTRLALQTARASVDRYPDATWLVEIRKQYPDLGMPSSPLSL
jgi:hypothetical protein